MKENAIYIPELKSCVKDFYIANEKVYYIDFSDSVFVSNILPRDVYTNYLYESNRSICYLNKNEIIPNLGIYEYQFNFLMGLTAILIAFSFIIGLVIVGATR